MYNITLKKDKEYIRDLLYEYLPVNPEKSCMICLQTEPHQQLFNPCKCTQPIHTNCLIKIIQHKKNKCGVCLCEYKINKPLAYTQSGIMIRDEIYAPIFFPFHDFYYPPLLSNPILERYSGMSRLTMAIMYLQVDRVRELLQEAEILEGLSSYYFGYEGYKQTPLIALATANFASNAHASFGSNLYRYWEIIEMLLNTKRIDVEKIDAFGKKFIDYINKNKVFDTIRNKITECIEISSQKN